jgi:ribokinase
VFAGAFAFYYANSNDLIKSAKFAHSASELSITKNGTSSAIPTISELEDFQKTLKNNESF